MKFIGFVALIVTMSEVQKQDLSSEDIVVWCGVISKYTSIKNFAEDGDEIRDATPEEIAEYKLKNCKS